MCSPFPATRAQPSLANTIWTIPFSADEEMWLFHFRGRQTLMPQHPNNGFHFSRNNYEGSRSKTAQWWYVLFSNYVNWQEQKGLITVGDLFLCLVEGPILNALCSCSWCFEQLLLSISDGQGQLEGQSHLQMISFPPNPAWFDAISSPFLRISNFYHSHPFPTARLGIRADQNPWRRRRRRRSQVTIQQWCRKRLKSRL